MRLPLEVSVRDAVIPAVTRDLIGELAAKLDRFHGRIMRCRVTIVGPGRHHAQGRWTLKIVLTVPGSRLVVNRQGGEDPGEALREAFSAATRRLEDHLRRRRGLVKTRAGAELLGEVSPS